MERIPYYLIEGGILIDLLALPVILVFCYGIYRHVSRIMKGELQWRVSSQKGKEFIGSLRIRNMLNGIIGMRVYQKPVAGIFHGLLFFGMLILLLGTIMVLLHVVFGANVMTGSFYQWFMAFGLDLAGLFAAAGLVFFLIRRLLNYPRLIDPKPKTGFIGVELLLLIVIVTGFFLEGLRINIAGAQEPAFVGSFIADLLGDGEWKALYVQMWWIHGLLALVFVAYIPFSPLVHLLFIPVNAALAETNAGADEKPLDLSGLDTEETEEEMPALGASRLADYSSRRLFDFSTCLWCGRCQEVCPATQTGKTLTPKGVMLTLSEMLERGKIHNAEIIEKIGMETLFECRTCGACVEACPAYTNPLKSIWNMRQNLMMERGEMPTAMLPAYRNMEALMHPFSFSASPSDWSRGLDVPKFKPNETEYLLWIGCVITYEDSAQKIGRAMVELLNKTGISYGIIEEARCTGDPAKQMGDDYLFSVLAGANIQLFTDYGVKKIITMCPHCYNSFTRYYPPLGGEFEVIPHGLFINDLLAKNKLPLQYSNQNITYHDPCYLGRHNSIFSQPRQVLQRIGKISEMPRNRENSFCCGAGGGNYWNEEEGERINYSRAEEAYQTGARKLATTCPFCLCMLTDGMKMYAEEERVFDIAELVLEQLEPEQGSNITEN